MAVLVFYLYGKEDSMTRNEAVRIIRKKPVPSALEIGFKTEGYENELEQVYIRTAELFDENANASQALYKHLKQILPSIAFYEALFRITGNKEKAVAFFDKWALTKIEKMVPAAQSVMKIGLYRKMPDICDKMLDKLFGPDAGFESREVPDAPKFARDMTVCPYYETCKKYGCPEITQFFCKSDDVTYGNLHPKLVWGRTQTLGMGGECCDFRLYLKEE